MCGIAGILSKDGSNIVTDLRNMLDSISNRGPDGAGILAGNEIFQAAKLSDVQYQNMRGNIALGHLRLAIVGGTCGTQPFESCNGRLILEHNGEIYNYKQIKSSLSSSHVFNSETDSEVIVHLLEQNLSEGNNMEDALKRTLEKIDGVYAISIRDKITQDIFLIRDRLGVRQLYYAENGTKIAFASEKKALWRIGMREGVKPVKPGHAVKISGEGRINEFKVVDMLPLPKKTQILYRNLSSAVKEYEGALIDSMKKRTQDLRRVGIIFSGGIDSVLIALLAKSTVKEVICYTGGSLGSRDIGFAKEVAKTLDLEIRVKELDQTEIERMLPRIIHTIEDNNVGQVEVAIPIYVSAELAHQDGVKVVFSGQGADELFGGYSWYPKIAEKLGYSQLQTHMREDLLLLYKETLEREDKITMAHSIEMREPYLDTNVIRVALAMDIKLNVRGVNDGFGKHVHRKAAVKLGIPYDIAYRVKEAAQHGSGIHDVIKSIANDNGYNESSVPDHYLKIISQRERMGSSQRYGYKYGNNSLWVLEPHVQMYLDSVANQ
jgi:asparagine synthase (glutamine-hydrolysing)